MTRWDHIWETFRALVQDLNDSLGVEARGYIVRLDRHSNDVFPFRAWVSYSPAAEPDQEQLVISLDFKRSGHAIVGNIDIARGDGYVLADQAEFDLGGNDGGAGDAAAGIERALGTFLADGRRLLEAELRPRQ